MRSTFIMGHLWSIFSTLAFASTLSKASDGGPKATEQPGLAWLSFFGFNKLAAPAKSPSAILEREVAHFKSHPCHKERFEQSMEAARTAGQGLLTDANMASYKLLLDVTGQVCALKTATEKIDSTFQESGLQLLSEQINTVTEALAALDKDEPLFQDLHGPHKLILLAKLTSELYTALANISEKQKQNKGGYSLLAAEELRSQIKALGAVDIVGLDERFTLIKDTRDVRMFDGYVKRLKSGGVAEEVYHTFEKFTNCKNAPNVKVEREKLVAAQKIFAETVAEKIKEARDKPNAQDRIDSLTALKGLVVCISDDKRRADMDSEIDNLLKW